MVLAAAFHLKMSVWRSRTDWANGKGIFDLKESSAPRMFTLDRAPPSVCRRCPEAATPRQCLIRPAAKATAVRLASKAASLNWLFGERGAGTVELWQQSQ
jgi:hypothetical protein